MEAVVCAELQRDGGGELGEQPGVVPGQGHRLRAVVTLLAHSHLQRGQWNWSLFKLVLHLQVDYN